MAVVTPEQFASFVRQDPDTWDAAHAGLCLDGAVAAVVEYCGWHIAPSVTEDIVIDGSGTRVQPLPTLHLTELNSVAENGQPLTVELIDWSANGVMEKRWASGWTRRRRGIAANITHGFDDTPAWVVTLICAVAARGFLTTQGIAAESAGGESITYDTRSAPPGTVVLMDVEKRMLDRIRLPLAA